MMIEPVIEIFGKFKGDTILKLREIIFNDFVNDDNEGMIHTLMWAFDMKSDWEYVENLVKKYAKQVTPLKKITPHKLRSTYGTALYQETGDIYLVADVLGHKDVNTTRKHYASVGDERRRSAAKYVKLRED